jgi:beta-glucanase (GH16 family)
MRTLERLFGLLLIRNSGGGWVDPDTKLADKFVRSFYDDRPYQLVFSDEFEIDGRYFYDGSDPKWTAIHKDDYTNYALHYYNSDLATTSHGKLNISTIIKDVTFQIEPSPGKRSKQKTKNYQSGMIQGWNKFCFTGGIVEISAQLPGKWDIGCVPITLLASNC